jgi:transcriptional regulator with XRE-family HTH domain
MTTTQQHRNPHDLDHRQFDPAKLRAAREARGRSREEVAARAGCSVSVIAYWELGYRQPDPKLLPVVAAAIPVPLGDLYTEARS